MMVLRNLGLLVLILLGVFCLTQGVGRKNFTKEEFDKGLDEFMKDPRKIAKNIPKYDPNDPKLKEIREDTKKLLRKQVGPNVTEAQLDVMVMEAERKFFEKHHKIKREMEEEEEEKRREKKENKHGEL